MICIFLKSIQFQAQKKNWINDISIPKETVTAIMMLYQNTKAKVRSVDGDSDFQDIDAGVLQGDTPA